MITATKTTMADLERIEMVKPAHLGRTWKGIEHKDLVKTLQESFQARGWGFTEPRLALDKTGAQLAGTFGLDIPDLPKMEDQSLSLGFLTANDGTRSLRLVIGTTVFVCTNGMVTGEVLLKHKHTIHFSLSDELQPALDAYQRRAAKIPRFVEALKQYEMGQMEADHILMEAGRRKIMGWKKLGDVSMEFQKPSYSELAVPTSWGLYNAFTHVIKAQPAQNQMDLMNEFRPLLPRYEGIKIDDDVNAEVEAGA